ncbi:MAG: hypothetical protein L6W00_13950 [Lentisphaeria bacterium]|nr:MAG: hypothetical protein L6W00_13950 [Lentisphaeria bacterium]
MKKVPSGLESCRLPFRRSAGAGGRNRHRFEIADKLLLYIPNRLVDALDMFTVNLGIGPVIEAQLMATRAIWGGAGIGLSYKAYKAHNRQYGFGVEEGWYWSFIFVSDENYSVIDSTPLVKKYIENRSGFPHPRHADLRFLRRQARLLGNRRIAGLPGYRRSLHPSGRMGGLRARILLHRHQG